jgi:hypothetical protein
MAPATDKVLGCDACGHAAGLHSNEAFEAIRCRCRVTRKMLASTSSQRPAPKRVAAVQPVTVTAEPAKRKRKRSRRRTAAAASGDTQAA